MRYKSSKAAPLDQRKINSMAAIDTWHKSVRKWYSATSNNSHTIVIAIKIDADRRLFLHKAISATARTKHDETSNASIDHCQLIFSKPNSLYVHDL